MAVDTSRQIDTGGEDLIVRDLFVNATSVGAAGTKVYSGGVLTSSAVQPSAGTATVAPLKFTSGTNNTTAQAGAVEYDGTAFYVSALASTREMVDAEQFSILQSSLAGGSVVSATSANIFSTGAATLTLPAGQYTFESQYFAVLGSAPSSIALQMGFGGTASAATCAYLANGYSTTGGGSSTTSFGVSVWQNSKSVVTVTNTTSSATGNFVISAYGTLNVSAGAAGTIIPQYTCAQNSISSGALTFQPGTFFRVWGSAGASTVTVGNWS